MAIAINGSGTVTGISVGGLPDGIVDAGTLASNSVEAAKIAANAVETAKINNDAVTVAKLADGVINYDEWWLTSSLTLSDDDPDDITTNLTRQTAPSAIGSAMTQSSGVFTFPETGIWYITCSGKFHKSGGNVRGVGWYLRYSSDNGSSWPTYTVTTGNLRDGGGTTYASPIAQACHDITDTGNQKIKFSAWSADSGATLGGTSSYETTAFRFTKLGNT